MQSGPGPMDIPGSLTARRPNASHLPSFELPPPPLVNLHKYNNYPNGSQPTPTSSSVTSFGNLLTPPSNSSADGLSPTSNVNSGTPSTTHFPSFTPTGTNSHNMWQSQSAGTPYGLQQTSSDSFASSGRGLFSPSLNSIIRSNTSPSDSLPPPPYHIPSFSSAQMSMSAPNLGGASHHQPHMIGGAMMGGHTPSTSGPTQASPVNAQEPFSRPPPTPSYYGSQPPSTQPQQSPFQYSSNPSHSQLTSPISAGGMSRMSPPNPQGSIPSLQSQHQSYGSQPRYSYPMSGPVLSNVNNPNGGLALVGGLPAGMMPSGGFNSGHAAHMQHMYGPPHPQPSPQNDRPFRCDQCPQSFNRNHDLKRHKRIHLAVKPFPCGHCDKSFSRKDALKRHVLVKGCGKAGATSEVKEIDGSLSPDQKSSSVGTSPIVSAAA
ncbi:hypothetical protein K431DRAFT_319831 [Polychaeton citri CBS 116435]|uniref:C2H2-type domain-containing protein n=1 Tax=Polychaeton citri CBS 116435 TaxID=1314669 RepID=A0A9P4Q9C5_9PEZI|nr:hypothetical protein K431DRAFT_319831 [Polychaeton citri CBS 116435]